MTADATITLRNQDVSTLQYLVDSIFTYGGAPVDRSGQIGGTYANTDKNALTGTLILDENIWAITGSSKNGRPDWMTACCAIR